MSRKRAAEGPLVLREMEDKHATLTRDYLHLEHEFVELKDRLQAAKMSKATLLAEVRFLRRRLKKLKTAHSDLKGNERSSLFTRRESSAVYSEKS